MRLSIPKINSIAHKVAENLKSDKSVKCLVNKNDLRLRIKMIITDELKLENDIDRFVRRTFSSMTTAPPEGSKEWDVMYEKFYEEEMGRRRRGKADGIRRMS